MSMISTLPVQARFFLLLVPRLISGRCSATRLAAYSFELKACGNHRTGVWCWTRVLRACAVDRATYQTVLQLCFRAGQYSAASSLASNFYDANGMKPATGIKLVGDFVSHAAYEPALVIYDRILREFGDDLIQQHPAPVWSNRFCGHDLRVLLTSRIANEDTDVAETETALGFARLCFSFGIFDTSAGLFKKSRTLSVPNMRDHIAEEYSLLRSNHLNRMSRGIDSHVETLDSDWLILRASVLFARGDGPGAAADVTEALRMRFQKRTDLDGIIADCNDIVFSLARCPATAQVSMISGTTPAPVSKSALRKIFVCGIGWTGSGAVYDALTEHDRLAEMPEAPVDRYLNDDTGNEMMFIQGPSGLGHIWRTARQKRIVRRLELWELFRCHVLGAGSIGYSEQKSSRAASNLISLAGNRYTGIFRAMFEEFSKQRDETDLPTMHRILNTAAESLTTVFAGDHACVVFNNAVFGRNLDMLAIFDNFRAAVVVRDPLDTYADRKTHDLKHWMSPADFVQFYRDSRRAIESSRNELTRNQAETVREVDFENFVLDQEYRRTIIDWLLDQQNANRVRSRFEPARSALNIGIHRQLLTVDERATIETELGQWLRG